MVDVTRIDKITRTDKAAQKAPAYSDFYTNFNIHPQNKRLAKHTNEEAVRRSVRNLLLTEKYERPFQPQLGSRLRTLLFENMSPIIEEEIKNAIEETINQYEPRARVLDIVVQSNEARYSYDIYIYFQVINSINPVSVNITLYRAR
jgi:phage baseplate assembly protein W